MPIRPQSLAFTILLGALAALPPLSIDMGLPAFPALQRELATSAAGAGLTLSVFMAGFSVAQLLLGPLSDRYGRRPVLLAGLSFYAAAGGLCAASPSIAALIGFRLIQGACAASGTVMAFAIARDLFEGAAARQRFSYVSMVLSVAPVIAPTLGGWTLLLGGWRAIYAVLGLAGLALLLAVFAGLKETRRPPPRMAPGVLGGFARMLGHRHAIGYALTNAMGFGALFAYISGSPLVLMGVLGVSAQAFGLLFAMISGGIMVGAWVNSLLAGDAAASRAALPLALGVGLLSSVALLIVTSTGLGSLRTLLPLLLLHSFSRGVASPNATQGALEPMGEIAGLASAMVGFLQMATAAVSSALVALLFPALGPTAMTLVMSGFAAAALLAWRMAQRPLVGARLGEAD
jgi:DHA1 family bicyclomycin/chloramphenicol resistance-like MFS transporter